MKYLLIVLLAISGCSYTPELLGLSDKTTVGSDNTGGLNNKDDASFVSGITIYEIPPRISGDARLQIINKSSFSIKRDSLDRIIIKTEETTIKNGIQTVLGDDLVYDNVITLQKIKTFVYRTYTGAVPVSGWEFYQAIDDEQNSSKSKVLWVDIAGNFSYQDLESSPSASDIGSKALLFSDDGNSLSFKIINEDISGLSSTAFGALATKSGFIKK